MVTTQWIGAIGSQVLRAERLKDAVHRLDVGGSEQLTLSGLRYSRLPPRGGPQEDPADAGESREGCGVRPCSASCMGAAALHTEQAITKRRKRN